MVTEGSSWKILFSLMNRALSWEESPLDSRGSGGNNAVFVQRMCKDAKRVWGFGVSNKGSSPEPTPWEGWRRSGNPKAPKVNSLEHWATPSFGVHACPPGFTVTAVSEGMWPFCVSGKIPDLSSSGLPGGCRMDRLFVQLKRRRELLRPCKNTGNQHPLCVGRQSE